jgi:hypothetical protein
VFLDLLCELAVNAIEMGLELLLMVENLLFRLGVRVLLLEVHMPDVKIDAILDQVLVTQINDSIEVSLWRFDSCHFRQFASQVLVLLAEQLYPTFIRTLRGLEFFESVLQGHQAPPETVHAPLSQQSAFACHVVVQLSGREARQANDFKHLQQYLVLSRCRLDVQLVNYLG